MSAAARILFHNEGTTFNLLHKQRIRSLLGKLIRGEGRVPGTINIIMMSDEGLLEMNRQYLGHDYYTDVISFDYADKGDSTVTGDVYISTQRVKENARTYGVPAQTEMLRVIVHGVLHLTGLSDRTSALRKRMTLKEDYYLSLF